MFLSPRPALFFTGAKALEISDKGKQKVKVDKKIMHKIPKKCKIAAKQIKKSRHHS
jgi:hypothetical protein